MENQDFDYQGMVILGASGNIGTRLIERVTESDYPQGEHIKNPDLPDKKNPIPHQHPTKIIAISDSTHYYVDINGISVDVLRTSEDTRANVKNLLAEKGTAHNGNLVSIKAEINHQMGLEETQGDGAPIKHPHVGYVDLTDSKSAKPLYQEVLSETKSSIVAVSKEVLGNATKEEFDNYMATGKMEIRPTVGAGMDAVAHLANYPESRETFKSLGAMISGTNKAICQKLDSEAYREGEFELSDIIWELFEAGDTEPYAHKDVGEKETDTKNKTRIMAMLIGLEAKMEDIDFGMPFVSESIGSKFSTKADMKDYIALVKAEADQKMRDFVMKNIDNEHTLRHIARINVDDNGKETISIGLEKIERDSDFAKAEQNLIIISDDTETVKLEKPGAGRDVTCKSIEQAFRNLVPRGLQRIAT